MTTLGQICQILRVNLQLGDTVLDENTLLLGDLPEFDSMAVVAVIEALQTECGIHIEDDDISGDTFASVASLLAFINEKQNA